MEILDMRINIMLNQLVILLNKQNSIPITKIIVDSIYMNAYKKILKHILLYNCPDKNSMYLRFIEKPIKTIVENMKEFNSETNKLIMNCINSHMKAESLIHKYKELTNPLSKEMKVVEEIIKSLIETGKYKTSNHEDYAAVYYPIINEMNFSTLRYPSEREFIICYSEDRGMIKLPNRVYIRVKTNLLQVSTSITNCDA